jgi:hypothetical protein
LPKFLLPGLLLPPATANTKRQYGFCGALAEKLALIESTLSAPEPTPQTRTILFITHFQCERSSHEFFSRFTLHLPLKRIFHDSAFVG